MQLYIKLSNQMSSGCFFELKLIMNLSNNFFQVTSLNLNLLWMANSVWLFSVNVMRKTAVTVFK